MPIFIVILAVAVLGGGYYFFTGSNAPVTPAPLAATNPVAQPTAPVANPTAPVTSMKKKYFDGQYSYVIPNKEVEKITVSLTLKDGVITTADFTGNPIEAGSKFNQGKFREGFKAEVVGKNIDEIALTVVNGASLSPKGFTEALEAIKVKAQTQA
jgi:uncharacterized protein with FMN-binding domain